MALEIERRFLVQEKPSLYDGVVIRQGYLAIDPEVPSSVRIRQSGGNYYTLTAKSGSGLSRQEAEFKISKEQFQTLWPLATSRIEKVRHTIEAEHLFYELDLFANGLEMVEVEFTTEAAAWAFTPPAWFGREVTNDPRFTNAWISRHGNPLTQDA